MKTKWIFCWLWLVATVVCSGMDSESHKSVKVPTFSGKANDYQAWWMRFSAYAALMGFSAALTTTKMANLPDTEAEGANDTNDQKKAREMHNKARYHLILAMLNERWLHMMANTGDNDWPGGYVHLFLTRLQQKFKPQDTVSIIELKKSLNQLKLKPGEDPSKLFEDLARLQNRFQSSNYTMDDSEVIATVISAIPAEYTGIITALQVQKGSAMTVDDVETSLKTFWRLKYGSNDTANEPTEGREILLANVEHNAHQGGNNQGNNGGNRGGHNQNRSNQGYNGDGNNQSQGHYNYNGGRNYQGQVHYNGGRNNQGHNNPVNGNNTGNRNSNGHRRRNIPRCWRCGRLGHVAASCWNDPNNAHLRPPNWVAPDDATQQTNNTANHRNNNNNPANLTTGNYNNTANHANVIADMTNNWHGDFLMCCSTVDPIEDAPEEQAYTLCAPLFPCSPMLLQSDDIWVLDGAATQHCIKKLTHCSNVVPAPGKNSVTANGSLAHAEAIATLEVMLCDNQGTQLNPMKFTVQHHPNAPMNLFSEGQAALQGYKIEGDATYKRLYNPITGHEITFDIPVRTGKGLLWAAHFKRIQPRTNDVAMLTANVTPKPTEMNIKKAHGIFGHMSEDATRRAAAQMGIRITRGTLGVCEACTVSKARRKNIPTGPPRHTATKDNDRVWLDQATLRKQDHTTLGTIVYVWCLMVFEWSGLIVSRIFRQKNDMIQPVCAYLHRMKQQGNMPKTIRMDNAGENVKLQQVAEGRDWKLGLHYEFTAPHTPQQNALAEVAFPTIMNRANAMCEAGNVPEEFMHLLKPKAIMMATELDGLQPVRREGILATKYIHQDGKNPAWAHQLRTPFEAGTVTIHTKIRNKSVRKGIPCVFVGYLNDHPGDCYQMWDPVTKRVHKTRDVVFLHKMFFAPKHPRTAAPLPLPNPTVNEVGTIELDIDETREPVVPPQPEPVEPPIEPEQPEPDQPEPDEPEPDEDRDPAPIEEEVADARPTRTRRPVTRLQMTHFGPVNAHINSLVDISENKSPAEIRFEAALARYGDETDDSVCEAEFEQELSQDFVCVITPVFDASHHSEIIAQLPEHPYFYTSDVADAYIQAEIVPSEWSTTDTNEADDEDNEDEDEDEDDDNSTLSTSASTIEDFDMNEFLETFDVLPAEVPTLVELVPTPQLTIGENADLGPDFLCVGAGIGGGFLNTTELHVMTYDQAMNQPDWENWVKSVDKEHGRMTTNQVFRPMHIKDIPEWATVLTTTWAMKKKANGTYRARMVARGFEQIDGEHYDQNDTSSPVVSEITIRVVLVLMLMAGYYAEVIDVCGAFLLGSFDPQHKMWIEVPQGFEKFYPPGTVLLLLKTLYGVKQVSLISVLIMGGMLMTCWLMLSTANCFLNVILQASKTFWKLLNKAFKRMKYERSKADACLQFMWTKTGHLLMWITWVDDCICIGPKEHVIKAKKAMGEWFELDETGPLKEYVGVKLDIDHEKRTMRMTQPVMIQSFKDEFDLPGEVHPNPAKAGEVLVPGKSDENISKKMQKLYRKGVGKLLHMMRYSRPDILNRVRELSQFVVAATTYHFVCMLHVMDYVVCTAEKGWFLAPNAVWDGKDKNFLFEIGGKTDSDHGKDPTTRRSISGITVTLNEAVVSTRSRQQGCTALSVTEAELIAAVDGAQDMLFVKQVLESMGLKVKTPMILQVDNKGAFDLVNNWSAAGRTRHVAIRVNFLRELKEQGDIQVEWIPNTDMSSDIFTKNVGGKDFQRHSSVYVR